MARFAIHPSQVNYGSAPHIHIVVGDGALIDARKCLSSELMTEKEIDEAIDMLINELKKLRPNAKSVLRQLNGDARKKSIP